MCSTEKESLLSLCLDDRWEDIVNLMSEHYTEWDYNEVDDEGNTALLVCCRKGELEVLKAFNKELHSLDVWNRDIINGNMMLKACRSGNIQLIEWLESIGCSIHDKDCSNSCMILAAKYGKFEVMKWLKDKGLSLRDRNDEDETPFSMASEFGSLTIVEWLLNNGCDIHEEALFNNGLHLACYFEHFDLIKYFISKGLSVKKQNYGGDTPLLIAAETGNIEIIKYLLNNGSSIDEENYNDKTAILCSSSAGKLEAVKFFREYGCSLENCLVAASTTNNLPLVKWLFNNGCSLDEINQIGTCIMNAAHHSLVDIVVWMLSNGSHLQESLNKEGGETCEDILRRNGIFEEVKKLLSTKSSRK